MDVHVVYDIFNIMHNFSSMEISCKFVKAHFKYMYVKCLMYVFLAGICFMQMHVLILKCCFNVLSL